MQDEGKICPKTTASFFSRLTYSWYSSLTYVGWKRPIVMSDVWLTRKQESALYNYGKFEHYLNHYTEQHVKQVGRVADKPFQISILKIIWSSFAYYFVTGSLFKLFNDVAIFISPMIMK